jgi:lysozyme
VAGGGSKDAWDKLSSLTSFLGTVVIAGAGLFMTYYFRQQEQRSAENQQIQAAQEKRRLEQEKKAQQALDQRERAKLEFEKVQQERRQEQDKQLAREREREDLLWQQRQARDKFDFERLQANRDISLRKSQQASTDAQVRVEELKAITALAPILSSSDPEVRATGQKILAAVRLTAPRSATLIGAQATPLNARSDTLSAFASIALDPRETTVRRIQATESIITRATNATSEDEVNASRQALSRIKASPDSPPGLQQAASLGLDLITRFEKFEPLPLRDRVDNTSSIGFSHQITDTEETTGLISIGGSQVPFRNGISRSQAMQLLSQDRTRAARAVDDLVRVPLNIYQREALVDFVWQFGRSVLESSTLLKKLNQKDYGSVPSQFMIWIRAGSGVSQRLVDRAKARSALWQFKP